MRSQFPALHPHNRPWQARLVLCTFLLSLCLFSWAQTTPTQTPSETPKTAPQVKQVLPTYEGQNVTSVELAGQPDLNTDSLKPLLSQQSGQPFSQAKVDQTVAELKQTGRFNDVQLQVLPEAEGIRVLFVLQPASYIGMYEFPGAERFSYSRLLQVTNYPPRGPYSPYSVHTAQTALETFLHRTGYFLAQVRPQVLEDKQHGIANVLFHVDLGKKAKFGQVSVEGTSPQETEHLQSVLRSFMARLRGSAIRPGKTFRLKTLQNATQYLENDLTKHSYLGAKVQLIGAKYNPETNRADISFKAQPGPPVHVKVEGAHLWSWNKRKLLPVYQQIGMDQELIQEGRQNLVSYFQSKGYFDTKVDSRVEQQPSGETIVYQITKGPRHKVADVSVAGNHRKPEKELLSHVAVQKGHFLSHGKFSDKLVRTSVKNLTDLYKADGFSDVKVTPQVKNSNGNISVSFRVDEGQQDIVQALRIEGNQTVPESQLAPKGLNLAPGKPYSQKLADEDRNHIMARYLEMGYLTATFRETARKVAKNSHQIEVVYQIREGPQVHIASIETLGRRTTKQRLINRETAFLQKQKPLRESDMLSSESELYTSNVFDWAEVDPRREITTQNQEDVVIKVHESKRNSITYGGGFEVINRGGSVPSGTVAVPGLPPVGLPSSFKTSEKTFYGPRGTFEYTRKNLWGKGESLTFAGLAGRLDQRASFFYTNPNFRWTDWSSTFTILGEHNSQNPIFTSRQAQFGWQLQRTLDKDKTKNFFIRYNFSETGLTRLLIPDLVPAQDQHVRLSTLSSSYIRDTRDSTLDAHKGIYQSFELDFNPSALGSNVNFGRLLAQTAYYKKIPGNVIWANSLRLGFDKAFSGSHVPLSESFFSGGGSTLRGFPLNGAGPQRSIPACGDPANPATCSLITVPIGGNQLLILNSEFRIPLDVVKKNLGVAAFYDGGNVFRTIGFHGQYTNAIGVGLRYSTPVGPVRIDIGHNLNAPPGIKSTQIFVTLGQAF